jgi:phosphatidylglycerophosphate synthase
MMSADPAAGPVRDRTEAWAAERARQDRLFAEIRAQTCGVVARHLNKRLSFPLTRVLLRYPVTPNQITVVNFCIGLAGCLLLLSPVWAWRVAGAALIQVHSVLDGCDGEVAKIKGLHSRLGAWLDTIADDVLNNVMFVCLFVGLYRESGAALVFWLGITTTVASLGMSFFIYDFLIRNHTQNAAHFRLSWQREAPVGGEGRAGGGNQLDRVRQGWFGRIKFLLKRDFFILVVLLCVVLNARPFLLVLASVPVWTGFLLYAASYFYGLRKDKRALVH